MSWFSEELKIMDQNTVMTMIEESEKEIAELQQQIAASKQLLQENEQQLRENEQQLRENEQQLRESEQQLRESSRSSINKSSGDCPWCLIRHEAPSSSHTKRSLKYETDLETRKHALPASGRTCNYTW